MKEDIPKSESQPEGNSTVLARIQPVQRLADDALREGEIGTGRFLNLNGPLNEVLAFIGMAPDSRAGQGPRELTQLGQIARGATSVVRDRLLQEGHEIPPHLLRTEGRVPKLLGDYLKLIEKPQHN